jgi:anti-sigma-K factor RskA
VNVKEYISSGIVESYVLALVSDAERTEFEAMCNQYPEIAEARVAFEKVLEDKLVYDAVEPPIHVKARIEEVINTTPSPHTKESTNQTTLVRKVNPWKWIAAASVILLALSAYWSLNNYNRNRELADNNADLQNQLQQSTIQLNELQEEVSVLQKPGMMMAALKGTSRAPEALATVYWDTAKTKNVYLVINNMPMPSSDRQYQLWALLDNTPVNLGVFDLKTKQDRLLLKMQNVQHAQAFAITLEPRGGSEKPTMDSMYVMGSL